MTTKKHFYNFVFLNTKGQHAQTIMGWEQADTITIPRIAEARAAAYNNETLGTFDAVAILLNVSYLGYMSDALMQGEIDADPVDEDLGDLEWTVESAWEAFRSCILQAFPTLDNTKITRDRPLQEVYEEEDSDEDLDDGMEIFTGALLEDMEVDLTWSSTKPDDFDDFNTIGDVFDAVLEQLGLEGVDDLSELNDDDDPEMLKIDEELAAFDGEADGHTNQSKDKAELPTLGDILNDALKSRGGSEDTSSNDSDNSSSN